MVAKWRSLSPLTQDVLAALGFGLAWFAMFDFWTNRGWLPAQPLTFAIAGYWSVGALALRRTLPRTVLIATALGYPLIYGWTRQCLVDPYLR